MFAGTYGIGSRDFRPEGILGAYDFVTGRIARKDGAMAADGTSYFTIGVNHPYEVRSEESPSCLPDGAIAITCARELRYAQPGGNLSAKPRSPGTTFEPKPNAGFVASGIEADALGLFLGESMADPPSNHPQPTQIILFLNNLWEFTGTDESTFLEEVRITYLHELGHYFGFDEDDLEERNLD